VATGTGIKYNTTQNLFHFILLTSWKTCDVLHVSVFACSIFLLINSLTVGQRVYC